MSDLLFRLQRFAARFDADNAGKRLFGRGRGEDDGSGHVRPAGPHPFDAALGIETDAIVEVDQIRTGGVADLYNASYVPSQPSVIRRAIEAIPVDYTTASFVDIGCGKGRALAVASEFPFRRIEGVELSGSLCEIARANARAVAERHPDRTPITITEDDALRAPLPDGVLIVYFFNAFITNYFDRFIERLAAHAARPEAKVFFVFYNPVDVKKVDRRTVFSRYYAAHMPFEPLEAAYNPYGRRADSIVIWQGEGAPTFPARPGADAAVRISANGMNGEVAG